MSQLPGPRVDVVDETFLAAPPEAVAAEFADAARWRDYWPDLRVGLYADRGREGMRWTVSGALVGTMEVWLEPVLDGTLLHYFLRGELPRARDMAADRAARACARESRARQLAAKRLVFGLKSSMERGRAPGEPPYGSSLSA